MLLLTHLPAVASDLEGAIVVIEETGSTTQAFDGVDALDHPGIIFRGPAHDRRAARAAGPDVWEIIARLRELKGSDEQRIATLADETDLHPREIRIAIDFATEHADDIRARIQANEAAVEASRRAVDQRHALLA